MSGTNRKRSTDSPKDSNTLEIEKKMVGKILDSDFTCSICLDTFKKPSVLECKHVFCYKCLKDWLSTKRTCPMCRKFIIKNPERCPYLGKLILDMQNSISTSNTPENNRRKTMYIPGRHNLGKENNKRPPWR
ncbi:uncharacterized RING finger protein T02C1.1-like isoform X2 [Sipha flava]|uniref:Uncharacterized RING finger protein T02C1.1-like isoform X2 n=1 Tax=Sipha flava TaxID=143950 RepID=A0A8B8G4U3_9HEMI|nr:uncharacterized RING finger protein T02C1.1-like isoform X2 [Sipha flava]